MTTLTPQTVRVPRAPVGAWMVLTIAGMTGLAYWDEARESEAALVDFAREQETLAQGISVAVGVRMSARLGDLGASAPDRALLASLTALDDRHGLRVFLATPSRLGLLATDGAVVRSEPLERAVREGRSTLRLTRSEAAALDLPERSAVAGIWRASAGPARWSVVAVASAGGERDRELRAKWRLLLSVTLASGVVLLFGGLAQRRQRKQFELARELSLEAGARERDERLQRADKLATLAALATGIAHEVSTPLGVIVGRAEQLLPRVAHDARTQRAVQAIIEQAQRINQVVRGILGLARGESPRMEHIDPARLAEAARELVLHRFTEAEVALHLQLAPQLPQVACEPRLFEQVLVNLLLNACDACQPGGHVRLNVSGDQERVRFDVLDDGIGISPLAAARATEPFFTTKAQGEGTGLGLAIANEIVKHHSGSLAVGPRTSEEGATGTRVSVELPSWRSGHERESRESDGGR